MEGRRSVIRKRTSKPDGSDGSVKGTGRKRGRPLIKASIKPETTTQQCGLVSTTMAISLIRQIAGMTEIEQNCSL
ncbi:hypothetical protein RchiOBHm_Chr6g0281901 [Rosa chinensis]|uniref:Uncharacterized protein n=1 Tax=Rosa chinensis TaxID=74649 RepID=A0A2P6PTR5_ROSCH|nr:hypothetical protein RchiOBHm_Chr6g0281901 [Rosa chinensis]